MNIFLMSADLGFRSVIGFQFYVGAKRVRWAKSFPLPAGQRLDDYRKRLY